MTLEPAIGGVDSPQLVYRKKAMKKICPVCSVEFKTYPNWVKRGGGKYCSRKCRGLAKRNRTARICEVCDKAFKVKPSTIKFSGAKYCSHKCMHIGQTGISKPSIQGSKAPNWRGGIQFLPYPFEFNNILKEKIRKRDHYVCQLCELTEEEHILIYAYSLVIHHIDYIKKNCKDNNLITLCNQCNSRVNFNRPYWTDFFIKKLEEIKI